MKLFLLALTLLAISFSQKTPEQLAQQQLDAYNSGNIEDFLKAYSEDVRVFTFPNTPSFSGKEKMRKIYGPMFKRTPDLHCKLIKRIVQGNTVIDHEEITGLPNGQTIYAIAIYKIVNNKISEIYFIQ